MNLLVFRDGCKTCLSWKYNPQKRKRGIVMIIPGGVGGSEHLYNANVALEALENGYDAVVVNHRD